MKAILLCGLAVTVFFYVRAIFRGRRAKAVPGSTPDHRRAARTAFVILLAYILIIEVCARIRGVRHDLLFWVHLSFAVPTFTAIALLVFWLNGERWVHHAKLAYGSAIFFLGTVATGLWMIITRF